MGRLLLLLLGQSAWLWLLLWRNAWLLLLWRRSALLLLGWRSARIHAAAAGMAGYVHWCSLKEKNKKWCQCIATSTIVVARSHGRSPPLGAWSRCSFSWPKPASRRMRQLGKARSHGRSPPRGAKGEIDEASALNGVHRSIVRFVERQVVGVFRIGSASQNKGLINRRK
jgi:hypothetical protein